MTAPFTSSDRPSVPGVGWLERGRRPALVSLAAAVSLAVFTGVRFVILIAVLDPYDYGRFNLLNLMINLLPLVMSAGLTLQYQRLVYQGGPPAVRPLLRSALVVTLVSVLPALVVVAILIQPLAGNDQASILALTVTATAAACTVSTFAAQLELGLGSRAASSLIMFVSNSAPTAAVLVAWLTGRGVVGILVCWTAASLAVCVVAGLLVRRSGIPHRWRGAERTVNISLTEGILSIPAQAGIWGYVFALRYLLGVNLGPDSVAIYAVAATVFDTAFLVAVSLLNYFTNRVMAGEQSPWRGLSYAVPFYGALSVVGALAAIWLLPTIGQDGFEFDLTLGVLLASGGLLRLYIAAWRPRAVGLMRTHVVSAAYIMITAAALATFLLARGLPIYWYGVATILGFVVVAAVQQLAVREARRS